MGKWKLVAKASKKRSFLWDQVEELDLKNWELYDMETDRTEMNNIASNHADLVQKMAHMWMVWARKTGAIPRPKG
jgi:arylsulfatase